MDGTLRLSHGSIQRSTIDSATGEPDPAGDLSFPEQSLLTPFPQLFVAFLSNLASDSVVFSLSAHTPAAHNISFRDGPKRFDPREQGPLRYHGVDLKLFHLYSTIAASYRATDWLVVGVSTSAVHGVMDFAFVRDTALSGGTTRGVDEYVALDDCGDGGRCDYEADRAAEAIRVDGSAWGLAFAAGVVIRPHRDVDLGVSYSSRVIGLGAEDISIKGDAWVRRSRAVLDNARADPALGPVDATLEGRATVTYRVPDAVRLGATWRATERLDLDLQLHWLNLSAHDRLDIRLTGSSFRKTPQTPTRIVFHRGFDDVFRVQLGAEYGLSGSLSLQGAAMVETGATSAEVVDPFAIDPTKLDAFVAVRWRLGRSFTLQAGYGIVVLPPVDVDDSAYSAADQVACVDAEFDVDTRQCQDAAAGKGVATTAGDYFLITHRLGISFAFHVD